MRNQKKHFHFQMKKKKLTKKKKMRKVWQKIENWKKFRWKIINNENNI